MPRRTLGSSLMSVDECLGPSREMNIPAEEVRRRLHSMRIGGKVLRKNRRLRSAHKASNGSEAFTVGSQIAQEGDSR